MAQDFWASSGFTSLERGAQGLRATPAWIGRFLSGPELDPPEEAGPAERGLHAQLLADPATPIEPDEVALVEDPDARENWTEFLRFRDRVLAAPTLEACYVDLYRRPEVDLAPPFVDALLQAIVRGMLDGTDDPWLCRAAEMLFRRQRIAVEGGKVLSADAATIQVFAETGGFGNVGRLLRAQNTPVPEVKMDVMNAENAALYFLRDELYGFVLDLAPAGSGAVALARLIEAWVAHMLGVRVAVEPMARIEDPRWRWHLGLDVDSTAILNSLYRGETVEPEELARLVLLFRLTFTDPGDAIAEMAGRPVYLGMGCRPDRTLKLKPQNLLRNLPLRPAS